ncbi:MAG: ABC transporter ATP-binding protein [Deltaproteobacteria bacterium]|nr:MAG: ABC transporter ATP-binding protein [Deltaproteobacteria bacterium]
MILKRKKTAVPDDASPGVVFSDVSYHYPGSDRAGITDISFELGRGACTVLAGCNGSGKSTLLKLINGLLRPQAGQIRVMGLDPAVYPAEVRTRVGMVFQDADAQIIGDTVFEDAAFGPENLGWDPAVVAEKTALALARVGLSSKSDQRTRSLSGGEKRRLAIAGALAMETPILVLDEPFANLDYPGVCAVFSCLLQLKAAGQTLMLTTHELEKVVGLADRLLVLDAGKKTLDGRPEDVWPHVDPFGVREPWFSRYHLDPELAVAVLADRVPSA